MRKVLLILSLGIFIASFANASDEKTSRGETMEKPRVFQSIFPQVSQYDIQKFLSNNVLQMSHLKNQLFEESDDKCDPFCQVLILCLC